MIASNFWSFDYASGAEALIKALGVSIAENKQFLAMVEERARIEHATASSLAQLSQQPVMHAVPVQSDEYMPKSSTLQSALSVFTTETVSQAVIHTRIASDLDSLIRLPLQKWCEGYAKRVQSCGATLTRLVSHYKELSLGVNKQRIFYYEQCHKYEDLGASGGSPRDPIIKTIRMLKEHLISETDEKISESSQQKSAKNGYVIAGLNYSSKELAELLRVILQDITLSEYKVPLLGSYQNVTTGSMIGTATRKHLQNDSFAYAEKFGQSLVDQGFLKPVGQISNRFQSTHTSHFQIQNQVFDLVEESDDSSVTSSNSSIASNANSTGSVNSSAERSNIQPPRLGATDASEEHYLQAVLELDVYRCEMELEMMQIYKFLDQLEQDREEAIKKGMDDFIRLAFRPEEQHQMQKRLRSAQFLIDPLADLRSLVLKNQTGPFIPTVTVFQGYSSGNYVQTFGVDLPYSHFLVDIVLDWLPTLPENETQSLLLWTKPESIAEVYKLRSQINTGKPFVPNTIFRFFPLSVVVSTLRQYLLELPESVVSFIIYERIKQLYSREHHSDSPPRTPNANSSPSLPTSASTPTREGSSQSANLMLDQATAEPGEIATILIQIPQINRQVLKKIIMYLRDRFPVSNYAELASSLALPLIRPRAPSAVNMNDSHPEEFIRDLLILGTEVFRSVDIKQKEMDALKEQKKRRGLSLGSAPPITSSPTTPTHGLSGTAAAMADTSADSGNNSLRPLNMAQDSRMSSFSSKVGRIGSDSPSRTPINPIVPLALRGRPDRSGQSADTSSGSPRSEITMPRLRQRPNEESLK